MAGFGEHFDDAPGQLELAFDRLVGVGVDAQRNRTDSIARLGQLVTQQFGRIGLGEQPGLEIQPRRQSQVRMRGPCEAIRTAAIYVGMEVCSQRSFCNLFQFNCLDPEQTDEMQSKLASFLDLPWLLASSPILRHRGCSF